MMEKFDKQRQARVKELAERIYREDVERNVSFMVEEITKKYGINEMEDFIECIRKDADCMWDEITGADSREEWEIIEDDIDDILLDWEGAIRKYFSGKTVENAIAMEIRDHFVSEYDQEEDHSELTYSEMLERMLEDGVIEEREAVLEILGVEPLIDDDFSPERYWSEIQELHDEHRLDPFHEVMEWWVVSEWLQEKLSKSGEVTFDFYGLPLWGRRETGYCASMSRVFQEIAENMLEDKFKEEDQERDRKLKEEVLPAFGNELEEVLSIE